MSLLDRRGFLATTAARAGIAVDRPRHGRARRRGSAQGARRFSHHPEPDVSQHRLDRPDSAGGRETPPSSTPTKR